ncbi:heat shock protein-related-like [Oryza sativa Japonica Group]|uniref:Heat shock protein-related-like n=1 Tax=Oryza sativa subsp. japonica TaxID=39947 RepID=Q5VP67_ORYSJ|nr:heat shock protein-related-like [Oryza sativa Japonica Group]BAD68758.1 heat shock protein-related-like [Oryza sativa Japonica Group]
MSALLSLFSLSPPSSVLMAAVAGGRGRSGRGDTRAGWRQPPSGSELDRPSEVLQDKHYRAAAAADDAPELRESPLCLLPQSTIATFKRAQVHQRWGFVETQQQPVLAECAAAAEAAARVAVERIRRGAARQHAQVVTLTVSRFHSTPREGAEQRLAELRSAVSGSGCAMVLVVEDLARAA